MISTTLERFTDAIEAHITVCNRFGILFKRFMRLDTRMMSEVEDGGLTPDTIQQHHDTVSEAAEAITDMQASLVMQQHCIGEMGAILTRQN